MHFTDSFTYNGDNLQASVNANSYSYDALNRLASAPNLSGATVTTSYDSLGNVASMATAGASTEYFGHGAGSQLCYSGTATGTCTTPPTGATLYGDNATGGRCFSTTASYSVSASCTSPPSASVTTTYNYDQAGNLTCLTVPNTSGATCASPNPTYSSTFAYNGNGLRMSDTLAGQGTQQFTWDQTGSVPRILEDGTNAYLYGPAGNPATGNAPLELVNLSNASTLVETSIPNFAQMEVTSTGSLDAIRVYSDTGSAHNQFGTFVTPFGYAGGYTDPTGLVYLVHRYYDPQTSQFLTVDPLVEITGQAYSYAGNDPVNGSDPSGLGPSWSKFVTTMEFGTTSSSRQLWSSGYEALFHHPAQSISTIAGAVSAVTALVPGMEWMSIASGAVALVADISSCTAHDCNWASIALDALALIPGGAALHFANEEARAAGELKALELLGKVDNCLLRDKGFLRIEGLLSGMTGAQLSAASTAISVGR